MSLDQQEFDAHQHFDAEKASVYDQHIRLAVPGYEALHETALALLQNRLSDDAHVLIVGAGTGHEALSLALAQPQWHITGVDPSDAMLSVARQRIAKRRLEDRVCLQIGHVQDVESSHLDAATVILVMQFLPDDGSKRELLTEISKRLKPDGYIILVDLAGDRGTPDYERLLLAWKTRLLNGGQSPADSDKMFAHVDRDIHFIPESRITTLLQEAGFGKAQKFFQALLFNGWVAQKNEDRVNR